ncbi:hypothetical protein EOM09_05295 [bacterium]|nr:hypothetical protein [bacterium]
MKIKRAHILGLGETVLNFLKIDNSDIVIGVNDICRYIPENLIDYLIVLDPYKEKTQTIIKGYNDKRTDVFSIIKQTKPKIAFLSQLNCWENCYNFRKIELIDYPDIPCNISKLDSNGYLWSHNSPFIGVIHAYKLGCKEIILWGVDFINHHLNFIQCKNTPRFEGFC